MGVLFFTSDIHTNVHLYTWYVLYSGFKDNQSRVIYITMSLYYIYSLNGIVGEVILYITHIHIYIYNLTIPDPEIYVK